MHSHIIKLMFLRSLLILHSCLEERTCSLAVDLCSSYEVILHRPVKEDMETPMKDGGQESAKKIERKKQNHIN